MAYQGLDCREVIGPLCAAHSREYAFAPEVKARETAQFTHIVATAKD
jgi:hypothetical protein